MEAETTICEVHPSQLLNLKSFLISFIALAIIITVAIITSMPILYVLLVIPVGYAFGKYLQIKAVKLKITDQRIIVSEGVMNKTTNETELYRVRDSLIEEPFLYRMFGLGNVIIYTTDEADATLRFHAYKKPHWIKDQVRNYSEICRKKNRYGTDSIMIHEHKVD